MKIKNYFLSSLDWLNLLDNKGRLSISNIAVIVFLTKVALASSFDITSITALITTLLNYSYKRFVHSKSEQVEDKQ